MRSSKLAFVLILCCIRPGYLPADDLLDFSRDVRPILSDRCFFCHGPDHQRRQAELRLDVEEAAHQSVILPGNPEDSELVRRILSDDPDEVMPPPNSKLTLSESEKRILTEWVRQGAKYREHWSFQPIRKPALPEGFQSGAVQPVDAFVGASLAEKRLDFRPQADKTTLIRRLSFDLTGIPPTIEEVDAFLGDNHQEAYERVVDRLLSSQRYGERMAVEWLDVARYADTYGYQNDRYRAMWPWRDWVVRAFNDNLAYDQFITWQIAGDLLPNASRDQILATAFNRNHRQTNEGGSVEEEFRAEYVADRVNTFGAAFLGLTLECARCHDHKYDPISQREYYQLAAFFNSIDESGLYSHFTEATPTPTLQLIETKQADELAWLRSRIEEWEQRIADFDGDFLVRATGGVTVEEYTKWRDSLADVRPAGLGANRGERELKTQIESSLGEALIGDYPLEEIVNNQVENRADARLGGTASDDPMVVSGKVGNGVQLSGDNSVSVKAGGEFSRNDRFTISLWMNVPAQFERAVVFHRSRAWTDSGSRGYELLLEEGKLSAALIHFWPGNAIRVKTLDLLPRERWVHVAVAYDGSSRARGLKIFVNGNEAEVSVVRDQLSKHIRGEDGAGGGDVNVLALGQRFRDNGLKDGQVDELKVFKRDLTPLEIKLVYLQDASPSQITEALYNAAERELLGYFLAQHAEREKLWMELQHARRQFSELNDSIAEIMVMREQAQPRPTYVLARGAYDAPTELVTRGTPASILARDYVQPDRRDLARWLVDPEHPLTARVAVNRVWQILFGRGLVQTSEDFGRQGSLPSHPELLDWLAAELIESGWDLKRLIKTIVMSRTYCQQSDPTEQLLLMDPENILLTRGPAVRLPAEMIRDAALSAGGLLVEELGGPAVKPYQPEGLWKEKSGIVYQRDPGPGSHRRSLYTYWKRTSPPPAMMTLDASNREVCTVRRPVTMTPMQMLVLLNDPQYVEAARGLAERALHSSDRLDAQLEYLFRTLVTRIPSPSELSVLRSMYEEQFDGFSSGEGIAGEFLAVGDQAADPQLDATSLAAMTVVAEGLMTYDEAVMKR